MTRVFVLWMHPLFFETISLLLQHPQIDLTGARFDDVTSHAQIEDANPEILILERASSEAIKDSDLLDYLDRNVRVVWLSLDDNTLSEFTRLNHTVDDQQDLLSLVLDSSNQSQD